MGVSDDGRGTTPVGRVTAQPLPPPPGPRVPICGCGAHLEPPAAPHRRAPAWI